MKCDLLAGRASVSRKMRNRIMAKTKSSVRGTQNSGAYIRLNEIKKVPRADLLTPYKFNKGIVWI